MRVLLLAPPHPPDRPDPFVGVADALAARSIDADRHLTPGPPPALPEGTRLVAVSDGLQPSTRHALRLAGAAGLPTVLLMDGLVEHRNTFTNPRVGPGFLRPAPVHAVACAGETCADVLIELGNDAWATGLPRLDASPRSLPPGERLLVASARRPWFDEGERERLVRALAEIRDAADALGVPVSWRVGPGLDDALGVRSDARPLADALAGARAVLTTPSTLAVEAMLAGRPTGVIDAFGTPIWLDTPWVWDASKRAHLPGVIESLLAPDAAERSGVVVPHAHPTDTRSAERVADLIAELAHDPPRDEAPAVVPLTRLPSPVPAEPGRPRVVRLVWTDGDPDAGDARARAEQNAALARTPAQYDTRTLHLSPVGVSIPAIERSQAASCVVPRDLDHAERLRLAIDAARALEPSVVVAGGADLGRMAAIALSLAGTPAVLDPPADAAGLAERFDAAIAAIAARERPPPTDEHLRPPDPRRWLKPWADDPERAHAFILGQLRAAGYARVAVDPETDGGFDAAVFTGEVTPELAERAERLRSRGVGVAYSPALAEPEWCRLTRAVRALARAGASRVAVFGAGDHTRRAARAFALGLPIVGLIDDRPAEQEMFGLPVVPAERAIEVLRPDGVVLSSDAWEPALWRRASVLRDAGVPVRALYGSDAAAPAARRS